MSKAKKRQRESIRYEDLPQRICGGCDKSISALDTAGDYCPVCITQIREGLLDRARRLLIHSADERALVFEAILHIKSWTASNVRELNKTIQDYEEVQGLKIGNDVTAGVQRDCPYCGETYHPKRKDSPTCGKEECKKARSSEWQGRYIARKKEAGTAAKQQVENIPSAKTSHPGEGTPEQVAAFQKVASKPAPIQAEAVIEINGQIIRIPLTIQLDIKVEVNASRD